MNYCVLVIYLNNIRVHMHPHCKKWYKFPVKCNGQKTMKFSCNLNDYENLRSLVG